MAATGWDRGNVSAANYLGTIGGDSNDADSILSRKCENFLSSFRIENQFIYR